MAGDLIGETSVTLRLDRVRHLKLGLKARSAFQKKMGYTIESVFKRFQVIEEELAKKPDDEAEKLREALYADALGPHDLHALVWAGLLHEEPLLDFDRAGDLMDLCEVDKDLSDDEKAAILFRAVWNAFIAGKGKEIQKKIRILEEEMAAKRNGTGTRSITSDSASSASTAQTSCSPSHQLS